jgi:hypothetical protein
LRGQTGHGLTETLNFSGFKPGMAYKLVEFSLYPSSGVGGGSRELVGAITAGKTAPDPITPDFNDEGLIASSYQTISSNPSYPPGEITVINDTFLITQNLILIVRDENSGEAVNWQCRFIAVKMSGSEEAVTNYKQFAISDE